MSKNKKNLIKYYFPDENNINLDKLNIDKKNLFMVSRVKNSNFLIKIIKKYISKNNYLKILETNGGYGGLSIILTKYYNNITITEINKERFFAIKDNLELYKRFKVSSKITVINDNWINIIKKKKFDLIIIDPPWSGYSNKNPKKNFMFFINNKPIWSLLNKYENHYNHIIFNLPWFFNYNLFINKLNKKFNSFHIFKLEKVHFILVSKNLI